MGYLLGIEFDGVFAEIVEADLIEELGDLGVISDVVHAVIEEVTGTAALFGAACQCDRASQERGRKSPCQFHFSPTVMNCGGDIVAPMLTHVAAGPSIPPPHLTPGLHRKT